MPLFQAPPPKLVSSDQLPPVQGGNGNLWAEYNAGTVLAGNARGIGAVDWQQGRGVVTEVASGNYAVVGGGNSNTASGDYATVGGGNNNTASVTHATVGGGRDNTASGDYGSTVGGGQYNSASDYRSTIAGGQSNNASGDTSTVAGGQSNNASGDTSTIGGGNSNTAEGAVTTIGGGTSNTASASYATISGGINNTASGTWSNVGGGRQNTASGTYATVIGGNLGLADRFGMVAHASSVFGNQGDAQSVEFILRKLTSSNTAEILTLDGATTKLTIRNNTLLSGICTISGFQTTGAKVGLYQRSIAIKNVAGTTTLVHSSTIGIDHEDDATWSVTITADNTNDALQISCLGSTSDTVRWVAVFRGLEIAIT
jgi:hypothetical protein